MHDLHMRNILIMTTYLQKLKDGDALLDYDYVSQCATDP